jgi:penicillin amidase
MGLSMPGNWYEANLVTPEFQISGAMIPGAPFVVLGQNQHLAWSLTNIMADDTDFYLERLSPRDSTLVITQDEAGRIETEPLQLIRERIQVKDGDDVIHTVRLTPNGPLINDIYPSQGLVTES